MIDTHGVQLYEDFVINIYIQITDFNIFVARGCHVWWIEGDGWKTHP